MRGFTPGVVLTVVLTGSPALAGVEADVQAGVVRASRNDAWIPGTGGTKIPLATDLSTSPAPAFRLRLGYRIAARHLITALCAPLQINARGSVHRGTFELRVGYRTVEEGKDNEAVHSFAWSPCLVAGPGMSL